ncbi:MAG: aspartate ammonia-lyase [Candidatus Tectomicrobia bacterium]|uniref:Fumarate hydratase class II n=1 Tax=Tectimicrobiota bacterium TaxID=2528274 RepID=A0A932CP97_UNCTE|nr:aspartate ammonia-lyase [Candidatus Tectomicrobia bacterium]
MRIERDTLGERAVPEEAYYGIQTSRALENFPISGLKPHPRFVEATVLIKKAAAEANMVLGMLAPRIGEAIVQAADEVLAGQLRDQFVVDVFQAGAGTSHNMNINEVLANRAIEILGGKKGDYSAVHPNDHVNMGQSTNDLFPTAMRLASLFLLHELLPSLMALQEAFRRKAREFAPILKSGRTHLQDAVPLTLGQEFGAYAQTLGRAHRRIEGAGESMKELGIGGNAVGTGLNTPPGYREEVVARLRAYTGLDLRGAEDLVETTSNLTPFAELSGSLKLLALDLIRIANDLRLLSSGPRTGLAEIELPAVQPGSSMMPGKVNPVLAEALDMVAFQVIGNDLTLSMACQAGQLELNVMMPVMIYNLLQSLEILKNGLRVFRERCIEGIRANPERCRRYMEESLGLATVLNPLIGYEAAARVAKRAQASGKSLREVVLEEGLLSPEELDRILSPEYLTQPGMAGQLHPV